MSRLVFLLLILFSAPIFAGSSSAEKGGVYQKEAKKVVMFSATYCPSCLHVRKFLSKRDIPFLEFDIETSPAAKSYFDKLGGRGTPFLLVNNRPIQGFNERAFWHYYKSKQ